MSILTNIAKVKYKLQNVEFSKEASSTFELVSNVLKLTKEQTPTVGQAGDVVAFTITLESQPTITNVVLTDDLTTAGYTFVTGSVTVDAVSQPTFNPTTGINLGSFSGTKVVKFNATVN